MSDESEPKAPAPPPEGGEVVPAPKKKLTERDRKRKRDEKIIRNMLQATKRAAVKKFNAMVEGEGKWGTRRAADMTVQDKAILTTVSHMAAETRAKVNANAQPKMLGVVVLPAQRDAQSWERMAASDPKVIEAEFEQQALPAKEEDDGGNG